MRTAARAPVRAQAQASRRGQLVHLLYPLVLAALLFAFGVYGVLVRRNAIGVLLAVELMLGGVTLNLVAFDAYLSDVLHSGQVFALFVITIAAAEVGIGLAIVLLVFRRYGHIQIDSLRQLTEVDAASDAGAGDVAPAGSAEAGTNTAAGTAGGGHPRPEAVSGP